MEITEFLYQIKPVRADLMENQTHGEQEKLQSHFLYLQDLLDKGKLVLAGPCLDASFGVVILQNTNEEEAQEIMENDPAVLGKVMTANLYPFRVSLIKK
ncbi:YciI family protein [Fictibacillus nanhaiensis]|uniref:YciI family protein n=1 Tax=Fictibacillus nanhaiensis TaxID=742169 RepID=UPI002E1B67BF|nr:YciI family protein [Fictibacillus nanhaiensis]